MKQIAKTELHKRLPGDDWVGETRFKGKMNPTQRITRKNTIARQGSSAQPEKQPTTTTRTSLTMRTAGNTHLPYTWTGTVRFTVKEGYHYMDDNTVADDEPHVEAQRAKGLLQPRKPTSQQVHVREHELTHLPCRDWCPTCAQGRGRQGNYKTQRARQPVTQVDFAYIQQLTQLHNCARHVSFRTSPR